MWGLMGSGNRLVRLRWLSHLQKASSTLLCMSRTCAFETLQSSRTRLRPTATIIAMAERLADLILERIAGLQMGYTCLSFTFCM
ncbi:uncharacterized protein EI90DRAFT_1343073 [Cantharellus anzutake]|uniref:uncharacterized protein n=1 Tax=Cantharellus anzutake TaxID=1750568 RepID=UPI001903678D|nr:uncharacterized protein EI90DRAFT_1343073 [Cantharellus anzutake]KAF8329768.1 hypothetical protein EI90DRAFT_1343073 [Cantharellus anzutake]